MIYATLSFAPGKGDNEMCTIVVQFRDEQQLESYNRGYMLNDLAVPINNILTDGHSVDDIIELVSFTKEIPEIVHLDMSTYK